MITTDQGSCSDVVYGLFASCGYQFAPRHADITDTQLWWVDTAMLEGIACRERLHRGHVLVDLRGRGRVQVLGLPALTGLDPQPQVIGLLPEHVPLRAGFRWGSGRSLCG
ncbi:Tn3 family transposase [Nonomuraea sp. NPDC026600]|uniref:Tn3 family transposase n=1 Tax=Nonomuraea sp. NPDC026600 TaxID=3155363 RepID=UPI0033F40AA5